MRTGSLLVAAAVLLALAGCVPSAPQPTAPPSASATPVFASDAEALAAAETAYAAYLRVSDQILQDGGERPDRLLKVATSAVYKTESAGYSTTRQKGWHSTGATTFTNMTLQSYSPSDSEQLVSVYVCTDVSEVDVVDAMNSSVVSPSRPDKTTFEVSFALDRTGERPLLVSDKEVWEGGGVC